MAFGQKILKRYGWREGDGLGKDGHGIKKAIKASVKNNNLGLGYNIGTEMTSNWWDELYNKASSNIIIEEEQSGNSCTIRQVDENAIDDTRLGKKDLRKDYDKFQKESLTENYIQVKLRGKDLDDYLFKKCKGRTGHKGARHGLYLTGKLQRIAKQEKEFVETLDKEHFKNKKLKRKYPDIYKI